MRIGPRKRMEMTERQVRVLELFHSRLSTRAISAQLHAEANGRKGWAVNHTTVAKDIKLAIEWHKQQAVDYYADWLAQELALSDHGHKMAMQAYEESRKIKRERTSLAGSGAASEDITTKAPDADLLREVREWQNQRIKLLHQVRDVSAAPETPSTPDGQIVDLTPYAFAVEQFAASVAAAGDGGLQPDGAAKPVPEAQTHATPGKLPAP